ncbi:MAG: hypothetical protein WDN00_10185 [Limisphaerales bacterium]
MFCGCAQLKNNEPANATPSLDEKSLVRNNAASLLYDLLGNEKNVSKILIIKRNSDELGQVIKAISEMAARNRKALDQLAEKDSGLNLHMMGLPQGEMAARAAVGKTKEHELLSTSGKEFEFNLLLTQVEALGYGRHLAKVAAENSSLPAEVQQFTTMSQEMENLYGQVMSQMRRITP